MLSSEKFMAKDRCRGDRMCGGTVVKCPSLTREESSSKILQIGGEENGVERAK
jgi:hypothetical protein